MSAKTVKSVDINGKFFEINTEDLSWRPSAYGIVIKDGAVLLVPQFGENRYDLPGGGIGLGEMPEVAVIREVKEETGLDVDQPEIIGAASNYFTFTHDDGTSVQSLLLYYICNHIGGALSTDGFDEQEKDYAKLAVWLPIKKLDSIELASSFDWRELVKKAAANANPGN